MTEAATTFTSCSAEKTRRQALTDGDLTYFGGRPCKTCGTAEKYTKSSVCVQCRLGSDRKNAVATKAKRKAISSGDKYYWTGHPCIRGHTDYRYVSSGTCIACLRENNQGRKEYMKEYRARPYAKQRARDVGSLYWAENSVKLRMHRNGVKGDPARDEPDLCECCGRKQKFGKRLAIDHDHDTGLFRGWLCNSCNLGIGNLGDDIAGLERALSYLKMVYKRAQAATCQVQ